DGRVAIVTGAASGIGAGIARAFAEEGARVAVADRDEAGAQAVAGELDGAIAIGVDVTDEAAVAGMVERALAELGGVHVLVSNAGIDTISTVAEMPLAL